MEKLPQANIDGVCFWLDANAPVIGMSLRLDRTDDFFFVLRHEIEHVLRKDGQEREIIDELDGRRSSADSSLPREERIANAAGANFGHLRHILRILRKPLAKIRSYVFPMP